MMARYLIACCIVLCVGCSSKKYYTPESIKDTVLFERVFSAPIVENNRYSATLQDGSLITQHGIVPHNDKIPKNARFLRESGGYYIFAKGCESLYLIRASMLDEEAFSNQTCPIKEHNAACSDDEIEIPTTMCALSASIKDNLLAMVGSDNSMNIIDLNSPTKEQKFSQQGASVLAVNALIAAPLFLESLVVFPTLDGKLLVVSTKSFSLERSIIISSDKFFNNVLFLEGDVNRIFAATAKKLIAISSGQEFSYEGHIKDVLFSHGLLYVLTLEGGVLQLDQTLRPIYTETFPYAKLEGLLIANNTLYTFETHGGYVIAINLANFTHNVYRIQDSFGITPSNKLNFYSGSVFYYNQSYLDVLRLR